jgi:hypothetical protein
MNNHPTQIKRNYQMPKLKRIGTVKQLTLASGRFGGDAGIQQTP